MENKEIQMLKDCIMFVLDNDKDLKEQDVRKLWKLNTKLVLEEVS